ncbi:MAG: O-antigen ligase family protein [Pirellulales bacterium]|nr:O-antigen ligase family protein [Pirellulales bacterium]
MAASHHKGKTARRAGPERPDTPAERLLLQIVDGALAGCIFAVPLLMGGRQALGQLALVLLAVVAAAAWLVRQYLRRKPFWQHTAAVFLLAAGAVLLVVQLAPLPSGMLAWASPQAAELLPLWSEGANPAVALGTWSSTSLTPAATRAGLALFLAYGLLFTITVQRIRRLEDVERLLSWIAFSALLMAGFALVQLLTSNGKFFWFYEHPFSDTSDAAKGSFTNRNHFAHFLALGIGPLIWWLQHHLDRRQHQAGYTADPLMDDLQNRSRISGLRIVALGIVLFAGLMSLSRGGMAVMFLAAALSVAVCYWAKTLGRRFVLTMAGAAVLIGALLVVYGSDQVGSRLEQLSSGSIETLDRNGGRRIIWAAVAKAIPDYALLGAGVGSHREVCPMYLEEPAVTEYTHAENGPLQVLLETGAIGFTLMLAGIGFCAFWCLGGLRKARSTRAFLCAGAITAGLSVSVVHSLADFVWYVPACMTVVALLAACACRTWQLSVGCRGEAIEPVALPRPVVVAAATVILATGTWMVVGRIGPTLAEPHWDRYRILALASSAAAPNPQGPQPEQQSVSPEPPLVSPEPQPLSPEQQSLASIDRMITELEQVVRWDPDHARARLRLAEAYLRRFDLAQQASENPMPLAQIRDAAIRARAAASDDRTKHDVEQWLVRTLDTHGGYLRMASHHARRGLALCPLQGEGYLCLAKLCFLEGPTAESVKSAYIDQALRTRARDGDVLFEAGHEAWLAGRFEQGMQYWQQSFRCGRKYQRRLIDLLSGRVPVGFLLDGFQPDLIATRWLHARYRGFDLPEELSRLRHYYAQVARTEAQARQADEAAKAWLEAGWLHHLMGESPQAFWCAQNAFGCDPNSYEVRHALTLRLAEQHRFVEAEQHLAWCLLRRPDDQRLRDLKRYVVKGRIDAETKVVQRDRVSTPK